LKGRGCSARPCNNAGAVDVSSDACGIPIAAASDWVAPSTSSKIDVINSGTEETCLLSANDPQLRGEARVRAIFDRVRAGDADSAADLYAPDGVLVTGGGRIEGREAIRAFYNKSIAAIRPRPQVKLVLAAPGSDHYVALVEVTTEGGVVQALDLFILGEEGIRQMEIFGRPAG